jgi:RNA polymerase sigma factor (sigma-70 family)
MSRPALVRALDHIRATAGRPTPLADDVLLARFASNRDEAAFGELVRRHGPLVRGVARRRLADAHEADDVAQATFLALARQAGRLNHGRPLAGWLFTVAHRLACKAQARAARRDQVVVQASRLQEAGGTPALQNADPLDALTARELVAALDDELARLPDRYRLPLVLCALEGLSRDEAAVRLGWSLGSFRGRLERGRELLRKRLTARGLTVPAVLAGGLLATPAEAMPAALVRAVVRAAIAMPPAAAPVKTLIVAAVVLTALGVGAGVALMPGGQPGAKANPPVPMAVGPVVRPPRVDAEGVPLPPGVLARLGSSRMRHGGDVLQVEFAPDGKSLLSAGPDGARFWNAATGRLIHQFAGDGGYGSAVRFSPDGREVLSVFGSKPIHFARQNVTTGQELLRVQLRDEYRISHAFTRDGRRFAVGWQDKSVRLYDTTNGLETLKFSDSVTAYGLAFSPDGKMIAVAGNSDTVLLYDITSGQRMGELKRDSSQYSRIAFAPDGHTLAALSTQGRGLATDIDLWDVPARKHLRRITGPDVHSADHLAFSPDGSLLAECSQNPDVVLWETATGREARRFRCYPSSMATAFSSDGKVLAVASNSGTITLWDVATGKLLPASADPIIGITNLQFTGGGRRLMGTVAERIMAWDVASGREVHRYPDMESVYSLPVLSPDGRLIAAISDPRKRDVVLNLCDASTGKPFQTIKGKLSNRPFPAFTPDSRRVIVVNTDKEIHVFDANSGKDLATLAGHNHRIDRLVLSPDGNRLASASTDGSARGDYAVHLWDLQTFQEIKRFMPRRGSVFDVAFSPDRRRLVTVGGEPGRLNNCGEVQLWDVESGRELRAFEGHTERVSNVTFSPDGRTFATGSLDHTLRLWEVASGIERYRFTGHDGKIYSATFAPDGRMLAASSPDAPVYLWDVYARSEPHQPPTADEVDQFWTDLAAADAAAAFRSIRRLIAAPAVAVALVHDRLKPVLPADAERVKQLVEKLDGPRFTDRQSAAKELDAVADRAADQLRAALTVAKSAEVRQALQAILDRLDAGTPETLRALRSVEVLEQIGSPAAREQLKALAGGAASAALTRAAAEALKRLDSR